MPDEKKEKKEKYIKVKTPEFVVRFPKVFAANDDGKYELTMLFKEGETLDKLKAAAKQVAKNEWGDDIPSDMRSPFRDQGDKKYDGYIPGSLFVKANTRTKPGLVDGNMDPIIDPSEFYDGCLAMATLAAGAYGGDGTTFRPGVKFFLNNIQKTGEGDPLSGRSKPEEDFKPIDGGDKKEDSGDSGGGLFD